MTEETQESKFTAEDKLHCEVEKLTEEVRVLKHPFSQPASWIAVIAFIVSIVGNIWQFNVSRNEYTLAEIKRGQVDLDRQGLERKRDNAKAEYERLQQDLATIKVEIGKASEGASSPAVKAALSQVEKKVTNLEEKTQNTVNTLNRVESPATTEFRSNLQIAKDKEKEAFQDLIDGDYDGAIAAFKASENAVNSFHCVYELANLIEKSKPSMGDPVKKKAVFQRIIKEFSYGAPPDLLKQIKDLSA